MGLHKSFRNLLLSGPIVEVIIGTIVGVPCTETAARPKRLGHGNLTEYGISVSA